VRHLTPARARIVAALIRQAEANKRNDPAVESGAVPKTVSNGAAGKSVSHE